MKVITLASMIMSVTVIADGVIAKTDILGRHCANADSHECGTLPHHNNGVPFAFLCGPQHTIIGYEDCPCSCDYTITTNPDLCCV
ncbi:hypothetical protein K503DRAFT_460838 [Rhizopogon vinicolor AM-OR11-026]|uniref:Uncharacterized protein n=1 Tax=Rhizopogon vinicolor AM-OR11-026 TaxID=1314800 RepID=A0A1B7MNQ8_9AGAM|nr:hypothetical protein K503DRAFT_460838 [Rhizopogon vinicolor AM-OR11-026]